MQISESYAARNVRFLELWETRGWRIKVYGLAYEGEVPQQELTAAAKAVASRCLPERPVTANHYGVGFMGVHQGRGSNLVFIDWWADENELRHHSFLSSAADAGKLKEVTDEGIVGCVWDLAVISFERDAWVASVLLDSSAPDLDRYLACRFDGAV